jgi:hypothetical protein
VQEYADVWGQFDPLCTNLIDYDQLPKLLRRLSPPLGFAHLDDSEPTPGDAVDLFIQKQLPLSEDALVYNKVHFVETFMSLVKFQYGMQDIMEMDPGQIHALAKEATKDYPSILTMGQTMGFREVAKIVTMQIWWRAKYKRMMKNKTAKLVQEDLQADMGTNGNQTTVVENPLGFFKGKGSLLNEVSRSRRQSEKDSDSNKPQKGSDSKSRQNRRKSQKIDTAPVADRGSESSSPGLGWWDGTKVEETTDGTSFNQRSDSPGGRQLAANTHTLRKKDESGDSAAEPPVKPTSDEKDEHASLMLELRENATRLFHRYDLDESGTVNSQQELQQITINLAFTLELQVKYQAMQDVIDSAMLDKLQEEWCLEQYISWFVKNVLPLSPPLPKHKRSQEKSSS